jgi:hypothetical protein
MKPPKISTSQMYRRFCEGETESSAQSPMYDKLNSCMRKKVYLSTEEASIAATNKSAHTGENYVSYRCRWCNLSHIGHLITA